MEKFLPPGPAAITITDYDPHKEILEPCYPDRPEHSRQLNLKSWASPYSLFRGYGAKPVAEFPKQQQRLAVTVSSEIVTDTNSQRTPIGEGHKYDSITASNDARQVNGDMGLENGGRSRRNIYKGVKATGKSRQVNGNLSENNAKGFWG